MCLLPGSLLSLALISQTDPRDLRNLREKKFAFNS